jgi:hypothetical protein
MTNWVRHAFTREVLCHPAAKRVDVDGVMMYVGMATVGSATSDACWQIHRIETETDGGVIVLWADGDDFFDNVWDSRAALSYI